MEIKCIACQWNSVCRYVFQRTEVYQTNLKDKTYILNCPNGGNESGDHTKSCL